MLLLKIVFWSAIALVFYTYFGYGILLYIIVGVKRLLSKGKKEQTKLPEDNKLPEVTLMICAYNEQDIVNDKMNNTLAIDYPKLKTVWVTDGSDDDTNLKLSSYDVKVIFSPERRGKTAALNHGLALVDTELVVMTDANTMLNSNAIREIVKCFLDPKVGCVAGEKRVAANEQGPQQAAAQGEGLYWKYESKLKQLDSELYSAMGAAGELCAIRRSLYEPMPENALLDDFVMSLRMLMQGYRIAYTPKAYALEHGSANLAEEAKRKKRIAAGGLQSIWWLRQLMNPLRYPIASFQFVSHRVLRWTITPFALFCLIPLNIALVLMKAGMVYNVIWILQIVFYLAALCGHMQELNGKKNKFLYIPCYFVFMNLNVFYGISYLQSHKNSGKWEKSKRA